MTDSFWSLKLKELRERRKEQENGDFSPQKISALRERIARWEEAVLGPVLSETPERKDLFENLSGIPLNRVYTQTDVTNADYFRDLGLPGEYPYTRGVYPTMYRGRPWTMRMFSGFGTADQTNKRLKYLLKEGETGLSIAFDMPTLYGYDADSDRAEGEVGKCGVSVSSLEDMETIFEAIPLDKVSTSMTINAPAAVLTAMYAAVGEEQGVPLEKLRGTVQTDILKEYIAQKEWAFPPDAHLRIIRDLMVFCTKRMPYWHYISISGYHIREAGASAVQELAFTLADGFLYVQLGKNAGLDVDSFAPRFSFFFNCDMDFFEEIAKFRAARRIWATVMKEKYGAKNARSMLLRFHTQTSGVSLTWQQPLNNVIRTTIEALAAVLGGTQSLHTNSYDEAWALPTEDAATVALRTQQILAEETGVTDVIDPLGGSYYLEWLTNEMEEQAYVYFEKIEQLGGVLEAIKQGYIQREIANTSYHKTRELEQGKRFIVGVNKYEVNGEKPIDYLKVNQAIRRKAVAKLRMLKRGRDERRVAKSLEALRKAFEDPNANSIYPILGAVKAYATLQEIMDVGRQVFGGWKEPVIA
ncbi:MAG TPA: methylmalonyl-CoA mutase family protein [Nitrososphaerales archaeon]|nr:methylmalonyl-CoA mutase family protein [Nitrososphaerales archaeon]